MFEFIRIKYVQHSCTPMCSDEKTGIYNCGCITQNVLDRENNLFQFHGLPDLN